MPLRNNKTSYQRLQEDLDYRLDQINKAQQAAFDAVNRPATQSKPSGYNSAVRRQNQLRSLGFYKGAIDGKWGKGSNAAHRAAVNAGYVLNSNGMYVKSPKAQKALHQKALTETESRQAQLKQLGFYKGKIDNNFGPGSRAAHQAAIDAGYTYSNGQYVKASPTNLPGKETRASIMPDDALSNVVGNIPMIGPIYKGMKTVLNALDEKKKQQYDGNKIIYLHYPEYENHSKNVLPGIAGDTWNVLPISDVNLPVGHDAVILVDKNGKTKYYEYGRINNATPGTKLVGEVKPHYGNVRNATIPNMQPGETEQEYVNRIKDSLPYGDAGAVDVSVANGADVKGAEKFINDLANNPDRNPYSIANTCATFASNVYNGFRKNTKASRAGFGAVERGVQNLGINQISNALNSKGIVPTVASLIPGTTHAYYAGNVPLSDKNFRVE